MKILFVSHSSQLAGAERSLLELVREATNRGHSGVVTLPTWGPLADSLQRLTTNFEIVVVPTAMWMGSRFWFPVSLVRFIQSVLDSRHFYRLMNEQRFDIVVSNSSVVPEPMIASRLTGTKSVLVLRESVMTNPSLKTLLPRHVTLRLLRRGFNRVIVISEYVKAQLGCDAAVIPPQVSSEFLKNVGSDRQRPSPEGDLEAVMVGTLSIEKGQIDAIRAVARARSAGAHIRLTIYGAGSRRVTERMAREIRRQKVESSVSLVGSTEDAVGAFRSADLTLVCSRNEAFGKTSAESVLVGTPVVGYASGATPEIITEQLGMLVRPGVPYLAGALFALSRDRELLERWARRHHTEKLRSTLAHSAHRVLDEVETAAG